MDSFASNAETYPVATYIYLSVIAPEKIGKNKVIAESTAYPLIACNIYIFEKNLVTSYSVCRKERIVCYHIFIALDGIPLC